MTTPSPRAPRVSEDAQQEHSTNRTVAVEWLADGWLIGPLKVCAQCYHREDAKARLDELISQGETATTDDVLQTVRDVQRILRAHDAAF